MPMSSVWLWLWFGVVFALLFPWVGYGWGYRGWGPPYPRYFQRRRMQEAAAADVPAPVRHDAWGWHGDAVWAVFIVATFWVVTAVYWWR